jgi:hypothetical protein
MRGQVANAHCRKPSARSLACWLLTTGIVSLLLVPVAHHQRPRAEEEERTKLIQPLPNGPQIQVMALRQTIETLEAGKKPAPELVELAGLQCELQDPVPQNPPPENCLAMAQHLLGFHLLVGRGVTMNVEQGVALYTRSAEAGLAEAQYGLALLYDEGQLIPQDDRKALFWYDQAAHQEHVRAQTNIGSMYQLGRGVSPSPALAADWFLRAARHGSHTAQWNLGILYMGGHGIEPDARLALFWLRAGAQNGEPRATFLTTKIEEAYERCFKNETLTSCTFTLTASERERLAAPQNVGSKEEPATE